MNKNELKNKMRKIFLEEDPMGIYYPEDKNIDEYDPEIEMIINQLDNCNDPFQLSEVIQNVLKTMFSEELVGPQGRYVKVADRIWELIKADKKNS